MKCWGGNNLGQLGAGTDSTTTPNIGKTAGDMGDNLPPVDLGANLRPGTLVSAARASSEARASEPSKRPKNPELNALQ